MKKPTRPINLFPCAPRLPPEKLEENTNIGSIDINKYYSYTMESFVELIKTKTPNYDIKDIKLEFGVEADYEDGSDIVINLFTEHQVPNPNFDNLTKKYEADIKKYKAAKKKYDEEMAIYEREFDKWMLEQSRAQVKKLQDKIKKQEKVK